MWRTVYLLTAYDGGDFHGWQRQSDGLRTVQGVIEEKLRRVVRHPVDLVGCGRTDAGVHAAGHVSSFETTRDLPPERFRHAIGSRLPDDITIVALRHIQPGFDATRHALCKLYRYRIHNSRRKPVEQATQRHTYHCPHQLDLKRMQAGAAHFLGEQDFRAMAAQPDRRTTTIRTILRCDLHRQGDEIRIDVEGTGFLYHQVRNMVGTLLDVGRGRWEPDDVRRILASKDRANAGSTVPARGLCLQWVRYPPHLLKTP